MWCRHTLRLLCTVCGHASWAGLYTCGHKVQNLKKAELCNLMHKCMCGVSRRSCGCLTALPPPCVGVNRGQHSAFDSYHTFHACHCSTLWPCISHPPTFCCMSECMCWGSSTSWHLSSVGVTRKFATAPGRQSCSHFPEHWPSIPTGVCTQLFCDMSVS